MFKKTSAAVKIYTSFFFEFSLIFREKSTPNRRKTTNNGFVHKNRQRIHDWNAFFHQRVDFQSILGVPLGPQGPPETSGSLPEAFMFFINFQLCLKIGPDRLPGGPRKAPDDPQAPPGRIEALATEMDEASANLAACARGTRLHAVCRARHMLRG